ncbi:META domain-containing protein [Shewanella sp. D64]|uniref:META domain-containing protein n=1 Tax=unclassified Shewanella TaxID=196818 RepID=UPI0022BA633A|nr:MULTISPECIES: META domain-containing protein [unclassified Shewanella]MEC4728135.1 META domain-containing protein [Shewanella sp. D64]MEC4740255.1 META domain-containing protein [Shewanella sp. E94]WBJ94428.1 META domain-containing protein [Shewanella sp. MTB7]
MSIKYFIISAALIGLTACQSSNVTQVQNIKLQGTWNIEVVANKPVIDYSPAQLIFAKEGKLSGNNSCNNFFGSYFIDGENIRLTPAGNTMKACVDALMDQEQRVMAAMPEVTNASLVKGKLVLKDAMGKTQLVLSKL